MKQLASDARSRRLREFRKKAMRPIEHWTAEDARRIVEAVVEREKRKNPWPAHEWEDIWGGELELEEEDDDEA